GAYPPQVCSFLKTLELENPRYGLMSALQMLKEGVEQKDWLGELFGFLTALTENPKWAPVYNAFSYALFCYGASPDVSKCGRRLAWIDGPFTRLKALEIAVTDFPEHFPVGEYWPRIPDDHRVNWGHVITGSD